MRYKLNVLFNRDVDNVQINGINFWNGYVEISVIVPLKFSLADFVFSDDFVRNSLKDLSEFLSSQGESIVQSPKELDLLDSYFNGKIELNKFPDMILFCDCEHDDVIDFLEKYSDLQCVVVIPGYYTISSDLSIIKQKYAKYYNKLYINTEGNTMPVKIEDFVKTINIINEIVDEIKSYHFSPFESLIYAYDVVRDRVYCEEDINESLVASRDLTKVLLGKKIVCDGFAKILQCILTKLGISNKIVLLDNVDNKKCGHTRNVVYLCDPKYQIDGIYYLDATWGSKSIDQDRSFLESYKFFAKTKKKMLQLSFEDYIDTGLPYLNQGCFFKLFSDVLEFFKVNGPCLEKSISDKLDIINTINYLSGLIDNIRLLDIDVIKFNKEKVMERLYHYFSLFDSDICCEKFLQALLVIKIVQYDKSSDDYPLSFETFKRIAVNSEFDFLSASLPKLQMIDLYLEESGIKARIEQINLQKKLKK